MTGRRMGNAGGGACFEMAPITAKRVNSSDGRGAQKKRATEVAARFRPVPYRPRAMALSVLSDCRAYPSRRSTFCDCELAMLNALVEACTSTWFRDRFEVSCAKSVSRMALSAALVFS